jgi:hypothetical protein
MLRVAEFTDLIDGLHTAKRLAAPRFPSFASSSEKPTTVKNQGAGSTNKL